MFFKEPGISGLNLGHMILYVIKWWGEPFLKLIVLDHLKGDAVTSGFSARFLNGATHLASNYKLPSTGTHHV